MCWGPLFKDAALNPHGLSPSCSLWFRSRYGGRSVCSVDPEVPPGCTEADAPPATVSLRGDDWGCRTGQRAPAPYNQELRVSDHWTRVGAKKSQRWTKEADAEQNQCCVIDSKEPRVPCQKLRFRPLSPALGVQSKWDWAGSPEAPPAPAAAPAASPCPHHSPGSSPRPLCTSSPLLPEPGKLSAGGQGLGEVPKPSKRGRCVEERDRAGTLAALGRLCHPVPVSQQGFGDRGPAL